MSKVVRVDSKSRELVFYSPNQLMSLDLRNFNRFQVEVMEILMQYGQKVIKFGGDFRLHENGRKIYILKFVDILDNVTELSDRVLIKDLVGDILKLSSLIVETYDSNRLANFCMFTSIAHVEDSNEIEFMLSDDLEVCFSNKNNTAIQNESKKAQFTSVDLLEIKNMNLDDYTRNLFKNMLKHFLYIEKENDEGDFGCIEYPIEEFRGITNIGDKYKRYTDLNKFVLSNIQKELFKNGLQVEFENKTFARQTIKITVKILLNDKFLAISEDLRKRAYAKDKKPKSKKEMI